MINFYFISQQYFRVLIDNIWFRFNAKNLNLFKISPSRHKLAWHNETIYKKSCTLLLDHAHHFIICFLSFLDLLSHCLLLGIVFPQQFCCVLYLRVNVSDSVSQGCFHLLPVLVDKNTSDLLVDFRIFLKKIDLLQDHTVLALLLVQTVSCLYVLLGLFVECVVFFNFLLDFVLESLQLHLGVHWYIDMIIQSKIMNWWILRMKKNNKTNWNRANALIYIFC